LRCELHRRINYIWNKETNLNSSGENLLFNLFIESAKKTDCTKYIRVSLITITYKIIYNIIISNFAT